MKKEPIDIEKKTKALKINPMAFRATYPEKIVQNRGPHPLISREGVHGLPFSGNMTYPLQAKGLPTPVTEPEGGWDWIEKRFQERK